MSNQILLSDVQDVVSDLATAYLGCRKLLPVLVSTNKDGIAYTPSLFVDRQLHDAEEELKISIKKSSLTVEWFRQQEGAKLTVYLTEVCPEVMLAIKRVLGATSHIINILPRRDSLTDCNCYVLYKFNPIPEPYV